MTKPTAPRKADIDSKLEYANHRVQDLLNALHTAHKSSSDPAFLVHTCADIISTVRECFDYLGQDIIAAYIAPNTQNPKTAKTFADGTLKAYFPYFEPQITRADSIFGELKAHSPKLYQDLIDFTKNLSSNSTMPGTRFQYQLIADVRDMVNEKKHDKLLAVTPERDAAYLIETTNVTVTLSIRDQKGVSRIDVVPGAEIKQVSEYRFAHNDEKVGKFCMYAVGATSLVVNEFYKDHFES